MTGFSPATSVPVCRREATAPKSADRRVNERSISIILEPTRSCISMLIHADVVWLYLGYGQKIIVSRVGGQCLDMSMLALDQASLERRSLARNEVLFRQGDKVTAIYFIEE